MFNSIHISHWVLSSQVSRCHIDKVDSLIWQATLWNVLDREIYCCFQDIIWQDNIMVFFIKITDTLENLEGIFSRRSINLNFVETTSKSSVLQDSVTVFILSCCTNHCQFTTWKSRFQDISKTFRSLAIASASGTKNLVDFIEEEDNISSFFDFIYQVLNVFFKATTVLRTSFKSRNINWDDFFVLDSSWDITIYDGLCQTFNYGCFTNTGVPDKDWVILGTTSQDFASFLDFFVTSDNWIQFTFASFFSQVSTKFSKNTILFRSFTLLLSWVDCFTFITRQLTCLTVNSKFFRCHFATVNHVATVFWTVTTHVTHQLIEKIVHIVKVVVHIITSFCVFLWNFLSVIFYVNV